MAKPAKDDPTIPMDRFTDVDSVCKQALQQSLRCVRGRLLCAGTDYEERKALFRCAVLIITALTLHKERFEE